VQAISVLGGIAYLLFNEWLRDLFNGTWSEIIKKHPIPFYYCVGVFAFFVVMGVAGIFIHCCSTGRHGRCADGCGGSFPCYGLDCFPASMEAFGVFLIMFVIIFAILGFFYCLLAATMAIQRIWQNHYHILTKHILTKVCKKHLNLVIIAHPHKGLYKRHLILVIIHQIFCDLAVGVHAHLTCHCSVSP
jgi:hypothetical protein